jgi:FkbM family methyltransferase
MEQQVKELQPLTHSPPLLHARRFLRDLLAECVAVQPVPLKAWAFRHFQRYILGALFRLEDEEIALAPAGPSGHVHAFEPMPETFGALQQNIRLNGLTNVCLERVAAGSTDSPVSLISPATQKLSWTPSVCGYSVEGERNYLSVPATSLDHYVKENRLRPSFIKIDVEGEELSVLLGARGTLVTARTAVFVEVHDRGGSHEDEVRRFLQDCGYRTTIIGVRNREAFCLALPCV